MGSKPKRLPIQVGTIIYNEKERLPKWLKFWKPIAERIIIIDQGSDDGTQDILRKSGVTWFEKFPRGNADVHWNELIGAAYNNIPFFRLGVDEFITRGRIKNILKAIKDNPAIALWWMRRINWIDGIDSCEHPEIKQMLGDDLQPIVSFGRPYAFSGRMHGWANVIAPGDRVGIIERNVAWVDHRRTLDDVIAANESRAHMCRSNSGEDQEWFIKVCKELVERHGEK